MEFLINLWSIFIVRWTIIIIFLVMMIMWITKLVHQAFERRKREQSTLYFQVLDHIKNFCTYIEKNLNPENFDYVKQEINMMLSYIKHKAMLCPRFGKKERYKEMKWVSDYLDSVGLVFDHDGYTMSMTFYKLNTYTLERVSEISNTMYRHFF